MDFYFVITHEREIIYSEEWNNRTFKRNNFLSPAYVLPGSCIPNLFVFDLASWEIIYSKTRKWDRSTSCCSLGLFQFVIAILSEKVFCIWELWLNLFIVIFLVSGLPAYVHLGLSEPSSEWSWERQHVSLCVCVCVVYYALNWYFSVKYCSLYSYMLWFFLSTLR